MTALWDEDPRFMDLYSTVTTRFVIQFALELEIKIITVTTLEARDPCLSFTQTLCKLVGLQLMAPAQSPGSAKSLE